MKNYFFTLLFLAAFGISHAQVGINTPTPDASAALDVESTTQGMLVPRMTEAQRDLVATPATGLLVYQTDGTAGFYFYDGTAWTSLSGGGGGAAGGTSEPDSLVIDAFSIDYDTIYIDDTNRIMTSSTPASFWGDKQHVIFLEGPGVLTQDIVIGAITASRYHGRILSIRNRTSQTVDFVNEDGYDPVPENRWSSSKGGSDLLYYGISEVIYDTSINRWVAYSLYQF